MVKYKKLKLSDGSTIDEHRHIMQLHLGRKLDTNECVHHIDGNPRNNELSNLELKSRSEHSKEHWVDGTYIRTPITDNGRMKISLHHRGEGSHHHILTESDVIEIKQLLRDGMKSVDIADIYGVSRKTIGGIKQNRTWKHVN